MKQRIFLSLFSMALMVLTIISIGCSNKQSQPWYNATKVAIADSALKHVEQLTDFWWGEGSDVLRYTKYMEAGIKKVSSTNSANSKDLLRLFGNSEKAVMLISQVDKENFYDHILEEINNATIATIPEDTEPGYMRNTPKFESEEFKKYGQLKALRLKIFLTPIILQSQGFITAEQEKQIMEKFIEKNPAIILDAAINKGMVPEYLNKEFESSVTDYLLQVVSVVKKSVKTPYEHSLLKTPGIKDYLKQL